MSPTRFRNALLAGAALAATTGAVIHASSGAPIEPVTLEQVAAPVDQSGEEKAAPVRPKGGWAIYVAGAAALGLLARLVGFRRIAAGAKAAAAATLESAKVAGRAVRRALASPFRAAVFLVSLGLVGFVGVGLYDVEWLAGMAFGAIVAAASILGAHRARRALASWRSPVRR